MWVRTWRPTGAERAFLGSLGSLDPFRVSTPQKVGSLPYVPRLDHPEEAVEQAGVSTTSVEVHHPPQPPTPALWTTVPGASRWRHQSCVQGRPIGEESESEESCRSLPVMSPSVALGRSLQSGRSVTGHTYNLWGTFH